MKISYSCLIVAVVIGLGTVTATPADDVKAVEADAADAAKLADYENDAKSAGLVREAAGGDELQNYEENGQTVKTSALESNKNSGNMANRENNNNNNNTLDESRRQSAEMKALDDDYVDLYGYGKAFATSSWYHEDYVGKWDPKQAFLITGDGNDRYWCSEHIQNPPELTAIWFQFEQPKRVIKIRFEESTYKLQQGGIYEVFASNDYGKCGNNDTQTKLAGGDAMEFSRGKEFTNKESYHCYGVRTYSYGQYIKEDDGRTYKVMALRRIQLRIEAPPNGDILRKLLKLTNDVERHGSRLAKVEEAAVYACEIGNVSYSARTPHVVPGSGMEMDPAQKRQVVVTFRLEYGRKPKVHMAATVFKPDKPLENEGWSFYPFEITKTGFKAGVTLRAKNDAYEDSKYEAAWIACGIIDLGNIDFRPVDGRQ